MQWRLRNLQKRVMHFQSCCFSNLNLFSLGAVTRKRFPCAWDPGISRIPACLWIRGGTRCAHICEFIINWPFLYAVYCSFRQNGQHKPRLSPYLTGSPSSKYEHRRASALLCNIQNIRIFMGKKAYRFCNRQKWKDFNKTQLTLLKMCVTSLLCGPRADLWPFYGFFCERFSLSI